eukprot:12802580-Ditylum_brightwellii.AAC.1
MMVDAAAAAVATSLLIVADIVDAVEQKIVELSWAMMNAVDKRIDEWVMVVQGNQSSKFEEDDD